MIVLGRRRNSCAHSQMTASHVMVLIVATFATFSGIADATSKWLKIEPSNPIVITKSSRLQLECTFLMQDRLFANCTLGWKFAPSSVSTEIKTNAAQGVKISRKGNNSIVLERENVDENDTGVYSCYAFYFVKNSTAGKTATTSVEVNIKIEEERQLSYLGLLIGAGVSLGLLLTSALFVVLLKFRRSHIPLRIPHHRAQEQKANDAPKNYNIQMHVVFRDAFRAKRTDSQ